MKSDNHKLTVTMGAVLAAVLVAFPANAAVVAQYSFEGNLNDTAAAGGTADNLSYVQGTSGSASPQYVAGVPGLPGSQAALFDGNYMTAADSADVGLNDNTWTLETFVNVTTTNGQWHRLILKWSPGLDYHFALETQDFNFFTGNPVGNVFDANTIPTPTDFTNGWHHLAVTSSATGSEAWIDGVSVFTGGAIPLIRTADLLSLGDSQNGPADGLRHRGWMDEVLIHDSTVDQNYINGRVALLVPEPSVFALFGLGGMAFLLRRRRG